MTKLLIATTNPGKLAEFAEALAPAQIDVVGLEALPNAPTVVPSGVSQRFEILTGGAFPHANTSILWDAGQMPFASAITMYDDDAYEVLLPFGFPFGGTEYRSAFAGGMLCCHCQRACPSSTYAERGSSSATAVRRSTPLPRWNRKRHALASETPTTTPNIGASRCQPMPAPAG